MRETLGRRRNEMLWALRCRNRVVSRYLFNAGPVRDFRAGRPQLSAAASRVATALKAQGVVAASAEEVVGNRGLLGLIENRARDLYTRQRPDRDPLKPYLVQLLGERPELRPDDPLVRFALDEQIRGIAEEYCGMRLRLHDLNVWVNEPVDGPAQQSQRWHRDAPEDHDIVKCFLYLADVTPASGPMQYIAGSNTRTGRRLRLRTEYDGGGYRLDDAEVAAVFPADRVVTATGPAGTVVFADTLGVHRGGHATGTERVVLQITYGSRASLRRPQLRAAAGVTAAEFPDVRFAAG